jgi:hypothetical protein
MKIDIMTRSPCTIEVDADEFGYIFAHMACDEQTQVFRSMIQHMAPHKLQWDYISIEIDKTENNDVREFLIEFVSQLRSPK